MTGRGVPPSPADCTTLRAAPGELGQASVAWRNPFAEPVEAVVSLSASSSSSSAGALELLLDPGRRRQTVGPLATVQLPVSFRPSTAEAEAYGEILVLVAQAPGLAEAVTWKLPLRGVVEAKQPQPQQMQQQPAGETEAEEVGGDAASASASASASAPSAFKFRCKALTRMEQVS